MTISWPSKPPTSDVVQGVTGRYPCRDVSSVDVHLRQLAKRMEACVSVLEMDGLLLDRDRLLDARSELSKAAQPA